MIVGIVVAILLASLLDGLLKINRPAPSLIAKADVGFRSFIEKNGQNLVSQSGKLALQPPSPPSPSPPSPSPPSPSPPSPPTLFTYQVSCLEGYQLLRVRQAPGLSAPTVATLSCSANGVEIINEDTTTDGEAWALVKYQTSTGKPIEGWAARRFLVRE
jgi:hypothetical protein